MLDGYINEIEKKHNLNHVIPSCIFEICFAYYYHHYLLLSIKTTPTPFNLLFSVLGIQSFINSQILGLTSIQHQIQLLAYNRICIEGNRKQTAVEFCKTSAWKRHFRNDIKFQILLQDVLRLYNQQISHILRFDLAENLYGNVNNWTEHEIIFSLMHHFINDQTNLGIQRAADRKE